MTVDAEPGLGLSMTAATASFPVMIDLRSDTVSRPSDAMRAVMASAEVGDDVWGDDPTTQRLEATVAALLGKEAAVYVSSGTQSNLCGLLAHCQRGDEYIVGDNAHTFKYEAGGAAVLGSIQPQTVPMMSDGSLDLDRVAAVVKPDDHHFARSKVLCMENTHDGKVQTIETMRQAETVGRDHGLAMHLDGARLWNAAAALNVEPADLAAPFDSVSVCLSKGLGAPIGSVLVGSAPLIQEARKWRKMLGGAMRQVGVIASAGLYAVENNRARMVDDHANAAALAAGLSEIDGVVVGHSTNMVFATLPVADGGKRLVSTLQAQDIIVRVQDGQTRLVTHIDVSADDIDTVVEAMQQELG